MKIRLSTFLFIAGIVLCACNENEPIPAYIKIDDISLTTDVNTEGWATEGIKDAWVYVDNQLVGAYEIVNNGAEFPVLSGGNRKISIGAGIFLNGISSTRTPYPFYKFYEGTFNLIPGQSTTINPTVSYFSNLNFSWIEDFEGSGFSVSSTSASDTNMIQLNSGSDTNVVYGNGAGYFALDTLHTFFEVETDDKFVLPKDNSPVFIELDYKGTLPFTVGVFAYQNTQTDQVPIVVINPKNDWNKIYIELAFTLSDFPSANDFSIFIGTFLPTNETFGEVFIDNIKLVHGN